MNNSNIILALDYPDRDQAEALVEKLDPTCCALKVGKHLFTQYGPELVREWVGRGFRVFLDLKYHDIPKTVADACQQAAKLGVWMLTVHASGGQAMLRAARAAIDASSPTHRPLLIAVTVLTSLDADDLKGLGMSGSVTDVVARLAKTAQMAGCDGVVCSAQEAPMLRAQCGENFILVTPGIRLSCETKGDQKRVVTPEQAIQQGANYLVIGRSITEASDPLAVLKKINNSINTP